MMPRLVPRLLLAALCGRAAAADLPAPPQPGDFAYAWPIATSSASSAYQIELTPEVYAALYDAQLRDLLVFNAAGEAVPLQGQRYDTQALYRAERVPLPGFAVPRGDDAHAAADDDVHIRIERDPDGRLRRLDSQAGAALPQTATLDYLLDASALEAPIDSLWLRDGDEGTAFSVQFAVAGSDDLQHWQPLVAAASVMQLRQGEATLVRRQIVLPQTRAKYLRLRRLDHGAALGAAFAVEAGISLRTDAQRVARIWTAPQDGMTPSPPHDHAATVQDCAGTLYPLPGPLPVDALRLHLSRDNSIAEISASSRLDERLDSGHGGPRWSQHARFTAFRLRQDGNLLENDEIAVGGVQRANAWCLESTPATPAGLSVAYRPDRFVFLAQGAAPFRLVAGQRTARRGNYPIDSALLQLRTRLGADWQPPLAVLGARETLMGAVALAPPPPPVVPVSWKSWLLWSILVLAAALVGGMALQLLKNPRDPGG